MRQNICKFIPKTDEEVNINILNFVYETKKQCLDNICCDACYKVYFVTGGKGRICLSERVYELEENDVFFTFPSTRYALESSETFEYMYISYLGTGTNKMMEKYNISKKNFLFKGFPDLNLIWEKSIADSTSVLSLRCEGILLYTISRIVQPAEGKQVKNELVPKIRKYIDENFTAADLSLDKLSQKYSYNKKYISTAFKKNMGVGISQYLSALRIQYACTLIGQGFTSVKDIAFLCGFNNPLYFSKVFKTKMGLSPKEHIKSEIDNS